MAMSTLPGLLRLPPAIRQQIFLQCECLAVVDGDKEEYGPLFINLNSAGAPKNYDIFYHTYNLLLTCRVISQELLPLVYRIHTFYIRYGDTDSLEALCRVRPSGLAAITSLTVHLNPTSCRLGDCVSYQIPWERPGEGFAKDEWWPQEPLSLHMSYGQNLLNEWQNMWLLHLRPVLQPGRLNLHVVCDVADIETGRAVVAPLLDPSPLLLKGCSLRLSRRRDGELQTLADRTVRAITGDSISSNISTASFPFFGLPAEIREYILFLTDLTTPDEELEYVPGAGMFWRYPEVEWNKFPSIERYHGELGQQEKSDQLVDANLLYRPSGGTFHERDRKNQNYDPACVEFSGPAGCYCKAHHSAASSIYPCDCWIPPTWFFLVSRQFRQEALRAFWGNNDFIIGPHMDIYWTPSPSPDRLPASVFLRNNIPKDALQFLRVLEIVFPPRHETSPYCPKGSPEWKDWVQTIEDVKDLLDLPKLTLRIVVADYHPQAVSYSLVNERDLLVKKNLQEIKENYMNLLKPLAAWKGLKRLFVYFQDPVGWKESEVESMIMGENYCAVAAGKFSRRTRTLWHEDQYSFYY